jgi:hypothetical protein
MDYAVTLEYLKSQGAMDVESQALDEAFADTDVKPRQRLKSLEIDYSVDEVDVARATFYDPDGRISRAIRIGSRKEGDTITYVLWTARIGYYNQAPELMTSLTGIAQMEVPVFPDSGIPEVTVKIFSASVALKKNKCPGGGIEEYLTTSGPYLMKALQVIAEFYQLELYLGESGMQGVIEKIDSAIAERMRLAHLYPEAEEYAPGFGAAGATGPIVGGSYDLVKMGHLWSRTDRDKNDAAYLQRIANSLTQMIQADLTEVKSNNAPYFSEALKGQPAKQDLIVKTGIWGGKLLFCFARDYLKLVGIGKIPALDYRSGNNLLVSFSPEAKAASDQGGFFARVFQALRKGDNKFTDVQLTPPDIDLQPPPSTSDDIEAASINSLQPQKFVTLIETPSDGSVATVTVKMDALKRNLNTDIKGTATAYGYRGFISPALVCLNGLGYGAMNEIKESEDQVFASYNRIYLIDRATHKMDQSGFYRAELQVSGCSLDKSDVKAAADFAKRIQKAIEPSASGIAELWAQFVQ